MKRWVAGQLLPFKWLRPGMGVKRWVLLLIGGLALMILAVSAIPRAAQWSGLWQWIQKLHLPYLSPRVEVVVLILAGQRVGRSGRLQTFIRSLLSAYRRANQDEVVDVVYRHRQRQRGPKW